MCKKGERLRLDFVWKDVDFDEKSGRFSARLEPDPRRYDWVEENGKKYLYDKLDKIYFPEEVWSTIPEKLKGLPLYYQPHKIDDSTSYIESRKSSISKALEEGLEQAPTFEDKSEEFLESLEVDELGFAIISIDIVGSTKLATKTDSKTYARLISTILYELSEVVPKFNGHVLKYTGDGLIAYFAEPSFITKIDLAVDCALTMRQLVYEGLNAVIEEHGYPAIGVRIGLDAGEAFVEAIGSPETKQHQDIIGAVVNLAAKIQVLAKPGEVYLGDTVVRNLHTMWRLACEPVDLGEKWDYRDSHGDVYRIHRVTSGPHVND